jgi:ATP-binding cassette, subfamily B, bacterial
MSNTKNLKLSVHPLRYTWIAAQLTFKTNPLLASSLILSTLITGLLPAAIAAIGAQLVDSVIKYASGGHEISLVETWPTLRWVFLEAALMSILNISQRSLNHAQTLLRAELGNKINVLILEKALTLSLPDFENSEFYDKLTRARREASTRPLSMVTRSLTVLQSIVLLLSFVAILLPFSKIAVLILVATSIPSVIAETRYSDSAFRLFRWRSADTRMQLYVESILSREESAKEIQLFGLGPRLLNRYQEIFDRLYQEDKKLASKRHYIALLLSSLSTLSLYGSFTWVAVCALMRTISIGGMSMLIVVFRQGQGALSTGLSALAGIYDDALYLSTLVEFLELPTKRSTGTITQGLDRTRGIEFVNVSFTYPNSTTPVLSDINLSLTPGQSVALVGNNGAGKTTLIKLLSGLYQPTSGHIFLDGVDLIDWDPVALRQRIGVIFQDFTRYQFTVGENIGAGDESAFSDVNRWQLAAEAGLASQFITKLDKGFYTQLGNWFENGQELSGGQWQKLALARAFMRVDADIVVLDEPTAAMDAEAEAEVFDYVRTLSKKRIIWLISHRFSTVRSADRILVLEHGRIIESGSHDELMAIRGRYSELFQIQAKGYL